MCKKFVKNRKQLKNLKPQVQKTAGRKWWRVFNYFLLLLVISSGLFYLNLVNNRAVSGYKIAELSKEVERLKKISERLEVRLAELQETERIKQAAEAMEMAVVEEVEYLVATAGELAQR